MYSHAYLSNFINIKIQYLIKIYVHTKTFGVFHQQQSTITHYTWTLMLNIKYERIREREYSNDRLSTRYVRKNTIKLNIFRML